MICNNTKELLAEIKKYMDLNNIQMKDLAVNMQKNLNPLARFSIMEIPSVILFLKSVNL